MGYSQIFVGCLVLVIVSQDVKAQPDPDMCIPGPGDAKGHRLPDLPERFKIQVYGEFEGRNYSVSTTEGYDDIENLGYIVTYYQGKERPGHISGTRTYYDYKDSQYYHVYPNMTDLDSYVCVTKELTNTTFTAFGRGGGHIPNAKDIFRFGDEYNETYEGQMQYKGETVDWWSACVYDERSTYNYKIDFYFVAGQHKATLPVKIVINGTAPLHWNNTHAPERRRFYHTYYFSGIDTTQQPLEVFYPPIGVICPGRVKGKGIPSTATNFNLNVEIVRPKDKTISYAKEFYYMDGKLTAFEFFSSDQKSQHHPIRVVHDYNTGIQYKIIPFGSCQVSPIPIYTPDAVSIDDEHVIMRTSASFFALHDSDVDWVYEGKTNNRDTVIHAWQTTRTNWKPLQHKGDENIQVNSTWMYFFLDKDWTIVSNSWHRDNTVLPMRLEIAWVAHNTQTGKMEDRGKEIHNFFQPYEDSVWHQYFDVSDCYTHMNESLHLAFNLEGKDTYKKYVANNTMFFAHGVAQSLADSLDVSQTRITDFEVVDGYKDLATVFFTLLDKPQVQGDAINATDPGPPLQTAYALLQKLINSKDGSTLTLEFIHHMEIKKVNAASNTLREETKPLYQTKQVGLTTGVASGIAIGTFVLGAAIAAVGACVVFKYNSREVPYSVQE
ncbi:uncharacterized protein [Amphiura filiformis]|uniref:uncharacterized protein n=1 Tax=Amphiura filiformis TaxID=82378 RepID=UPI003B227D92